MKKIVVSHEVERIQPKQENDSEKENRMLRRAARRGQRSGVRSRDLEPISTEAGKVQKIRFVEDDAQNYMLSKIYELKHQKANDLVPFLLGAIKR